MGYGGGGSGSGGSGGGTGSSGGSGYRRVGDDRTANIKVDNIVPAHHHINHLPVSVLIFQSFCLKLNTTELNKYRNTIQIFLQQEIRKLNLFEK